MPEYIEREALINTLNKENIPYDADINYLIMNTPAVYVVKVVRCKDCDYYREESGKCMNPHCGKSFYGTLVKENHFCSYGERNGNNDN